MLIFQPIRSQNQRKSRAGSRSFSRAWHRLHDFVSSCDWFIASVYVIGPSDDQKYKKHSGRLPLVSWQRSGLMVVMLASRSRGLGSCPS